ncbi:MAG: hypothetical protein ACK5L7_04310 [Paludibacteraceae bacterium]
MNKDILIVLIEKDIRELGLLTGGFSDMDLLPKKILQLAVQKGENIVNNLKELEILDRKDTSSQPIEQIITGSQAENELLETTEKAISKNEINNAEKEKIDINAITENEKPYAKNDLHVSEIFIESGMNNDSDPADFVETLKEYAIQSESATNQPEIANEPKDIGDVGGLKEDYTETASSQTLTSAAKNIEDTTLLNNGTVNENIKINDIRNAINIGDRFRFQRELFGGNGEVMNKTITYLNQLAKYDEAVSFLSNKFGWDNENKHTEDFLQIIKRRYL